MEGATVFGVQADIYKRSQSTPEVTPQILFHQHLLWTLLVFVSIVLFCVLLGAVLCVLLRVIIRPQDEQRDNRLLMVPNPHRDSICSLSPSCLF